MHGDYTTPVNTGLCHSDADAGETRIHPMPATISINRARERKRGEQFWIELCGQPVPAKNTAEGIRAVSGRAVVTAESAEAYLETKFGDHLEAARAAMTTLAHAYRPREMAAEAFALYEEFRCA